MGTTDSKTDRLILWVVSILLISPCLLLFAYVVIYRDWDRDSCYQRLAQELSVPMDLTEIQNGLTRELTIGMTRDDVLSALESKAPIYVKTEQTLYLGRIQETLELRPCKHPMNHMILFTGYTVSGELYGFAFDDEP